MTFLNPLVLLALAAAAIPVILHLINLQRPKRVSFSSLTFVQTIRQESVQRLRIRRWLLLAMRIGIVASLVLAFAGPTLPGAVTGAGGERDAMSIGIVMDTSPSMMYASGNGSRMNMAHDRLRELTEQLQRRDEVFTATTTDASPLRHGSVASAVERLSSEQPVLGAEPTMRAVSRMAGFIEREARHSPRAVVLISDLQRATFVDSVETTWPDNIQSWLVPVPAEHDRHAAVTDLQIVSPIASVGGAVEISATVRNFGGAEGSGSTIASLYLGDERVAERTLDLDRAGRQQLSFTVSPSENGWLPLRLELDDGGPLPNDRRYAVLHVPEEKNVLIVRGPGQETTFLETVLALEHNGGPLFSVDVIDEEELLETNLETYDTALLVGLQSLSNVSRDYIQTYVENGGGLHIFPGPQAADEELSVLLENLGGEGITSRRGTFEQSEVLSRVTQYDVQHPILRGVFEDDVTSDQVEQPGVFQYVIFGNDIRPEALARLQDGEPVIQAKTHEAGRVVTWSIAPDSEWSEMPRTGLFVPLMHRSVQFAAAGLGAAGPSLSAGRRGSFTVQGRGGGNDFRFIAPDGTEFEPIVTTPDGGVSQISLQPAPRAQGIYSLMQGGSLRARVAVNMDANESDPLVFSGEEAATLFGEWMQHVPSLFEADEGVSLWDDAMATAGARTHIWNLFILLAVFFVVAETVVARRWSAGKHSREAA